MSYNVQNITDFFSKIYKHNEISDSFEIRTIDRVKLNPKGRPLSLCFQFKGNITSGRNQNKLIKTINKIKEEKNCLYYSVYNYKPTGKYERINSTNSASTGIVIADFDHIGEEEFKIILNKFHSVGVYPIVIFSGHGYQTIFLLDKKSENKNLQSDFLKLFLLKGLPVDTAVGKSSGQIMRMPFTINWKNTENPINTTIYLDSEKRYSVEELFSAIGRLPDEDTYAEEIKKLSKKKENTQKSIKKEKKILVLENKNDLIANDKVYIRIMGEEMYNRIPVGIQKMLNYTEYGYRNTALFTIVNYFIAIEHINPVILRQIITEWCTHTNPRLDTEEAVSEMERLSKYEYPALHKIRDKEIEKKFGKITLPTEEKEEKIKISCRIFSDYKEKSAFAIRLYFAMCLWAYNNITVSVGDIMANFNKSKATVYRAIKTLYEAELIRKKDCGLKKKGDKEEYVAKYKPLKNEKFVIFGVNELEEKIFSDMSNAELKVYLGLRILENKKESKSLSFGQTKIGEIIGYTRAYISRITTALNKRKLIVKNTVMQFFKKIEDCKKKTRLLDKPIGFLKRKGYVLSFCTYQVLRI